mmetsp:Transcript_5191/g.7644  ORF Transcript_5191/g.7644 Transcript_5191/m.7644 type:complete len:661 (+) Transcript_5191:149-2131(+)
MSRSIAVQMERPHDFYFDPVYTVSGFGGGGGGGGGGSGGQAVAAKVLRLGAVSGANRFKYFRTPAVPTLRTVPPEVLLSVDMQSQSVAAPIMMEEPEPMSKTVATQSDYRDSEAQTDPFTPDYIAPDPDGPQPELPQLLKLTWGRGLPAGVAEVEMIERARKRRAFEASLPDISEDAETWKNMMEMQQLEEMARREAEIQSLQEQRLAVITAALESRDQETRFVNEQRMEELKERQAAAVETHAAKVHHQRIRQLRKIAKSRQLIGRSREATKRDIISDYANFGSKTYAPIKREGLRIDRDAEKFEASLLPNMTYRDLVELEESLPRSLTAVHITRPRMSKHKSAADARKAREMQASLDRMSASISAKHKPPSVEEEDDLAEYRKAPVVVRPPTPELRAPVAENDEKRLAVIFLERLLRGRAVQSDMMAAKEKRMQLIKELRTVETLEDTSEQVQRESVKLHQQQLIGGHIAAAVGREVGQQLDYLNQELVRFKEERRIHAMVMLAERQRSMREAEEKGKREEEEKRRATQDEMYRQIMQVHQGTVDTFLESVLGQSVENTSRKQAMLEANAKASFLNEIVDGLETSDVSDADIVKDLVSSFLLPEVSRSDLRTQVKADQQRLVAAAHEELVGALTHVGLAVPVSAGTVEGVDEGGAATD